MLADRMLTCLSCGLRFLDTGAEQETRRAQGVAESPKQCPGCRALATLLVRRHGVVRWYDPRRGYGFVRDDAGTDLFVHVSQLRQAGLSRLRRGQPLDFEVEEGQHGPQAVHLALADGPAAAAEGAPAD
jgi:CspA family cold shock protein